MYQGLNYVTFFFLSVFCFLVLSFYSADYWIINYLLAVPLLSFFPFQDAVILVPSSLVRKPRNLVPTGTAGPVPRSRRPAVAVF